MQFVFGYMFGIMECHLRNDDCVTCVTAVLSLITVNTCNVVLLVTLVCLLTTIAALSFAVFHLKQQVRKQKFSMTRVLPAGPS